MKTKMGDFRLNNLPGGHNFIDPNSVDLETLKTFINAKSTCICIMNNINMDEGKNICKIIESKFGSTIGSFFIKQV